MSSEAWEAFELAARGGAPDHVPVALLVDSAFMPGLFRLNTLDYFLFPRTWLRANITLTRRFPGVVFLPGFWTEYGTATEPSGFGAGIQWRHDRPPVLRPLNWSPDRWGDLPEADPYTDGLMALTLRHLWKLEKDGDLPEPFRVRFTAVRGPFSVAAALFGAGRLLPALESDRASVVAALDTITATLGRYLNAQLASLRQPAGVIVIDDTLGLLSPGLFYDVARPRLAALFDRFQGLIRVLHVATPCKPLLSHIAQLNFEVFHCGYVVNLADVKAALAPRIAIMGNVPPGAILGRGTPEQIESAARECIARGGQGGGFVLSAGGPVAAGTAPTHIAALVKAARYNNL